LAGQLFSGLSGLRPLPSAANFLLVQRARGHCWGCANRLESPS